MNTAKSITTLATLVLLATTSAAWAQPQSKLVSRLDKELIQAVWCSALFYEESYWHDDGSDWSFHYEDLAFALEDDLQDELDASGLGEAEIAEVWQVFDASALDLAAEDEAAYEVQLASCDAEFGALLPRPKT